ncbi:hypothetical protein BKA65DRAFT_4984 [Rhexocercosporidium sp. MPI-PUGE-AT-0058]|nr:hypothetical protein BKA65DRAFT_4984 [Rhexocercosporidium sp. MPI-PUGE-AT-0058]
MSYIPSSRVFAFGFVFLSSVSIENPRLLQSTNKRSYKHVLSHHSCPYRQNFVRFLFSNFALIQPPPFHSRMMEISLSSSSLVTKSTILISETNPRISPSIVGMDLEICLPVPTLFAMDGVFVYWYSCFYLTRNSVGYRCGKWMKETWYLPLPVEDRLFEVV